MELAELRRQILFLQGQLEDKEKTVQTLQEQLIKLTNDNYHANSAPASTVSPENQMCNAATQTERVSTLSLLASVKRKILRVHQFINFSQNCIKNLILSPLFIL